MVAKLEDITHLPGWPKLLSEQQAAAYLSLSKGVFSKHFKPRLRRLEYGRSVRYNRKDLDRLVDAKEKENLTDQTIKDAAIESLE